MLLFILAAVAVVVVVRWISERTGLPSAALLTIVGIGYALLPGPNVELQPKLVLTLVIPPLLYSAALDSSLIDIRRNLRTVISLSVALVLVTALLVGVGFALFVAGATFAAGVAVGAAVAPPDPAALGIRRAVIDAEREELLRWRDAGRVSDEGLRVLERELDHEEHLIRDRST